MTTRKRKQWRRATVAIRCETPDCPNEGTRLNTVTLPTSTLDAFMESFGHGSEDGEADTCEACGNLGVAEPVDE